MHFLVTHSLITYTIMCVHGDHVHTCDITWLSGNSSAVTYLSYVCYFQVEMKRKEECISKRSDIQLYKVQSYSRHIISHLTVTKRTISYTIKIWSHYIRFLSLCRAIDDMSEIQDMGRHHQLEGAHSSGCLKDWTLVVNEPSLKIWRRPLPHSHLYEYKGKWVGGFLMIDYRLASCCFVWEHIMLMS